MDGPWPLCSSRSSGSGRSMTHTRTVLLPLLSFSPTPHPSALRTRWSFRLSSCAFLSSRDRPLPCPHPWTGHAAARVSQRDLCTECFPDGFPSASLCLQSCGHLFAEFVTIRGSRSAAGSLSCVLLSLKCHAAILSQSRRATGAER